MPFHHVPVMLAECLDMLNIRPGGAYLDCTLGGGGHSAEILKRLNENGTLTGIDRDRDAISAATEYIATVASPAKFSAIKGDFHNARELTGGMFDGILLDLGVSSHQLDVRERGFSYHQDAPLDMRMDAEQPLTARDIVNNYSEDELTRIIRDYGEENWARQIARVICDRRPVETTTQLVSIIDAAIPKKFRGDGSHPARHTFQALRIAVNDELRPLPAALDMLVSMLNIGGRLCVITFHSLEDRIVKEAFRRMADPCTCPKHMPVCVCGKTPTIRLITRKPMKPAEAELAENPRSRSAALRVAERI